MLPKYARDIALLLFVIALASCSKSNKENAQPKTASAGDSIDLHIALMPVSDCLPLYVAADRGILKKEGLRTSITTYASVMACGEAMRKGRFDIAYLTLPEALYINGRGAKIKAVMGCDGSMSIITSRSRRIKKLSHMKERTTAISRFSTSDFLADDIAEITGVKPFYILRPQINDVFVRMKMLKNGQVDAAALPNPLDIVSKLDGNIEVFSTEKAGAHFGCICVSDSALERKGEKIAKLIKSYAAAAELINRDKHKADSVLIKIYRIPAETLDSISLPKMKKPESVDHKQLKRATEWSMKRGIIKRMPKAEEITTSRFTDK